MFVMAAEGGDLNDLRPEHDVRQTKTASDQAAVAEQLTHLFRRGVGGHVEIFRAFAQQQIADAAADQIGFIA